MSKLSAEASRALDRLRDPEAKALTALARMVVDETTATPLAELATPRWLASQLKTALEAATRGEALKGAVKERMDRGRDTWATDERPLREVVPEEIVPPLEKLLARPYTPSEGLMRRIVRQPPVRDLIARILEDTLQRFGRRMRALDEGAGGLGLRAARRGRKLGKGLLAVAGVAEAASDLARTLSEEVEHALESSTRRDGTRQPVFYALEGGERAKSSTPAVVHFNSHDGKAMLAALLPHVDG